MSSSTSSPTSEPLAVARVMGVRGLNGDLRVLTLTDAPDRLAIGARVLVEGEDAPRRITEAGWSKHGPVIRLEGIGDRDAAAALIGRHLQAPEAPAVLPEGTYWWHELEGLDVVTTTGTPIGRLEEVFRAGPNEVYRVVGAEGELLVPALKSVVIEIDVPAGRMVILDPADWLEEV
ncbi:MAG TPA: ribosome maturation factor RimM [Candidatus Limnocylindria bacterium]|jgi:16S rRNA processing protein RimM